MGEREEKCQYRGALSGPCKHEHFVTCRNPKTGKYEGYCIFHAPLEKKKEKFDEFWARFNHYYRDTVKTFEAAPTPEDKKNVKLDCEGFIFPPTGGLLSNKVFPFVVDFGGAVFTGDATFRLSKFRDAVNFNRARFHSRVDFESVEFRWGVNMDEAVFMGAVNFNSSEFREWAHFNDAIFVGGVDFTSVKFAEETNFWKVKFRSKADFRKAEFSNDTRFNRTFFSDDTLFNSCIFNGHVMFAEACFSGHADFRDAKFSSLIDFRRAMFKDGASFRRLRLTGAKFRDTYIHGVDFCYANIGDLSQKVTRNQERPNEGEDFSIAGIRLEPVGSARFGGAKYNVHNGYFKTAVYSVWYAAIWLFLRLCNLAGKSTNLPAYRPRKFLRTKFLGVDITAVDWSKNPRLGRDIKYQQLLSQLWNRRPFWLYRPLYFLWWVTSRCGDSFWRWAFWAAVIICVFGVFYAGYPPLSLYPGSLADFLCNIRPEMHLGGKFLSSPFDPYYISVLVFTPFNFGNLEPVNTSAKIFIFVEVLLGFVMLSALVSFFANKLVRRD